MGGGGGEKVSGEEKENVGARVLGHKATVKASLTFAQGLRLLRAKPYFGGHTLSTLPMPVFPSALAALQDLYTRYGEEAYGEGVTQLAHAYQAAQLAEAAGAEPAVVAAAFLHDVGHLYAQDLPHDDMGDFGVMDHDAIGASWLRSLGFPAPVPELVAGHVQAKRYLTWADPAYYAALSAASQATLAYQGGPMTEAEAQAFEKDPWFGLHLLLRHWDDEAKQEDLPVPPLDAIWSLIGEVWASGQSPA